MEDGAELADPEPELLPDAARPALPDDPVEGAAAEVPDVDPVALGDEGELWPVVDPTDPAVVAPAPPEPAAAPLEDVPPPAPVPDPPAEGAAPPPVEAPPVAPPPAPPDAPPVVAPPDEGSPRGAVPPPGTPAAGVALALLVPGITPAVLELPVVPGPPTLEPVAIVPLDVFAVAVTWALDVPSVAVAAGDDRP